jgi:hypothetical protein
MRASTFFCLHNALIHPVAAVTHPLPSDCLRDLDAINCSPAFLSLICIRAGELATMTVKQLRLEHPDNIDGTHSGSQWQGMSKERLIQDILFEEFSSGNVD